MFWDSNKSRFLSAAKLTLSVLASVFLLFPNSARALEISVMVPQIIDPATERFLSSLESSSALKADDISIIRATYEEVSEPNQIAQSLLDRKTDMALLPALLFPGIGEDPGLNISTLASQPGLTRSPEETFLLEDSVFGDAVAMELGAKGFVFLSFWNTINRSLWSPKRFGEGGLSTLEGAKVRTFSERSEQTLLQLSVEPIFGPGGSVFDELRAGNIDAAELAFNAEFSEQFQSAFRGGSVVANTDQRSGFLLANLEFWLSITEAERQAIDEAVEESKTSAREVVQSEFETAREFALSQDIQFLSVEERSREDDQIVLAAVSAWNELYDAEDDFVENKLAQVWEAGQLPRQELDAPTNQAVGRVFFVTNRNEEAHSDIRKRFGISQLADVQLKCGEFDYDRSHQRRFGEPYSGPVNVMDANILEGTEACAQMFAEVARNSDEQEITLFIHGYNTSFKEGLERAISMALDLEIEDPVVLWSWPSEGTKSGYIRDLRATDFNNAFTRGFVRSLARQGMDYEMSLIAHSMGGTVGLKFLEESANNNFEIKNSVFVAPDVPQAQFGSELREYVSNGELVSLYCNSFDRPLNASRLVSRGLLPAGLAGEHLFVMSGLDTIDVSSLDNEWIGNNHTHVFDIEEVAQDAKVLLRERSNASERSLPSNTLRGLTYYYLQ